MVTKPQITLVPDRPITGPKPPGNLGEPGRSLWNRIQSEYGITDSGGVEMLAQACAAADRAASLARQIAEDGETIRTEGGLKAHPCLKDELAARSFVVRTLQRLGLNFEPIKRPGRPGGFAGWVPNAGE